MARLATVVGTGTLLAATLSPLAANADVQRNQIQTLQYLVTVDGIYQHSYTVHPDPCGPDFTGTGQYPPAPTAPIFNESFSGSVAGAPAPGVALNYTDTYFDPNTGQPTGYTYSFSGTFTDAAGDFSGTATDNNGTHTETGEITGSSSTNYRNHGEYVNSVPASQRAAAAQSCVGQPVQSHG